MSGERKNSVRRPSVRLAVLVLLAALVGSLSSVRDVSAQPRDRAAAEALFQAGRDAMAKEDFKTACQRFEESNRLEPAAGTVLNIANCRERLGQVATAWQRYREALQKLPRDDERVTLATERAAMLESRLPKLKLTLSSQAPSETTVERDGVELGSGSLGVELPVDPGQHIVLVKAPGYKERTFDVTIGEGENKELNLEPGEKLPPEASGASGAGAVAGGAQVDTGSSGKTAGFVLGGIGLAAFAVSLGAGALALSKKGEVEDNCTDKLCNQTGVDAGESGDRYVMIANIAAAVGVVGVGLGAYFLISSPSSKGTETALSLKAIPGGGTLGLRSRF